MQTYLDTVGYFLYWLTQLKLLLNKINKLNGITHLTDNFILMFWILFSSFILMWKLMTKKNDKQEKLAKKKN